MRGGRRPLTREDLEAISKEFSAGSYGAPRNLDYDLHQLRRSARFGVRLEEWAKTQSVPLVYARALRRFLEQG